MSEQGPWYPFISSGSSSNQRPRASSVPDPYTPIPVRLLREQEGARSRRASDGMAAAAAFDSYRTSRKRDAEGDGYGGSNRPSSDLMPYGPASENRASLDIGAWTRDVADARVPQQDQQSQYLQQRNQEYGLTDTDAPLPYPSRTYASPVTLDRAALAMNADLDSHPYSHDHSRPFSLPPAYRDYDGVSAQLSLDPVYLPPPHPAYHSQHVHAPLPPPSKTVNDVGVSNVLPTFHQPPAPAQKEDVEEKGGLYRRNVDRVKAFWKHITTEPPLPSPPPSETSSSRRSSFSGERQPETFTRENLAMLAECDHDAFIRAMRLTLNDDNENIGGSGPIDADVQAFGGPNPTHEIEIPQALQRAVGNGKDDRTKPTYMERRQKQKHRIVYHKDCTNNPPF